MSELTEQEVNHLFEHANEAINSAEENGIEIPIIAVNELRMGVEHKTRAQKAESKEKCLFELEKARQHFFNASYEMQLSHLVKLLTRFKKIQKEFLVYSDIRNLPEYVDAVKSANKLQHFLIKMPIESAPSKAAELSEMLDSFDKKLKSLFSNEDLVKKSVEKSIKKNWISLVASSAGLIIAILSFVFSMSFDFKKPQEDVSKKISNLREIQSSLTDLQNYVTDQKIFLESLQEDITILKKEKTELQQVVDIENERIEQILIQYEKAQRKRRWIDWILSFLVGVFSSATVAIIIAIIRNRKRIPELK